MKQRIDEFLVENNFFESRTKAQAAIMAGLVLADEKKIVKSGTQIDSNSKIRILGEPQKFVSRGGIKLEHALNCFHVDVNQRIAIDIGASTGGFTDCLLKSGAKRVYAIDVGYGQIAWKLRQDKRIVLLEKTNARNLKKEDLYRGDTELADLAVVDVSFISLGKIFPALYDLLNDNAEVLALVKPQFEAGKDQVGKGGIVKEVKVHKQVLKKVSEDAFSVNFKVLRFAKSPIDGADGNKEFFIHLKKGNGSSVEIDKEVQNVMEG